MEATIESDRGSDREDTADLTDVSQNDLEEYDLEESEANPSVVVPSGGVEVIMDLREWLKCPWEKV